jgi:hypothetical protein
MVRAKHGTSNPISAPPDTRSHHTVRVPLHRSWLTVPVLVVATTLGVSSCAAEPEPVVIDSSAAADGDTQTQPAEEPAFEPDLSGLSPEAKELYEHYSSLLDENSSEEGTWVFVADTTVAEAVTRLLGPEPRVVTPEDDRRLDGGSWSAYSFTQVGSGVVAFERTGYADPRGRRLAALSAGGRVSAVVTGNIDAMTRFGYARDGRIVFDEVDYAFVEDLERIPAEVRDLAAVAWADPDAPVEEGGDWFVAALAMAEQVTGVRADPDGYDALTKYLVRIG